MRRVRVIPCLLLKDRGLVKTRGFKTPVYVGDPMNAVKIFNDKGVDELIFLDISATPAKRSPDFELIRQIAEECFMPFCYGGGISTMEQIRKIFSLGVEKISLNTSACENSALIRDAASEFGSQSIACSIDVKKNLFGKYQVWTHCGKKNTKENPVDYAKRLCEAGAGEIFLTSIDRDGSYSGYDLRLIESVTKVVPVPVVASGGAAEPEDFLKAVQEGGASAVSAGSMFVFHGRENAVLINFPSETALHEKVFSRIPG